MYNQSTQGFSNMPNSSYHGIPSMHQQNMPNMNQYNMSNMNHQGMPNDGDRLFFPFLTGALVGGAAVGLSRPRPIVNAAPAPVYVNQVPYGMPYGQSIPYGYPVNSYGGGYNYNYYGY